MQERPGKIGSSSAQLPMPRLLARLRWARLHEALKISSKLRVEAECSILGNTFLARPVLDLPVLGLPVLGLLVYVELHMSLLGDWGLPVLGLLEYAVDMFMKVLGDVGLLIPVPVLLVCMKESAQPQPAGWVRSGLPSRLHASQRRMETPPPDKPTWGEWRLCRFGKLERFSSFSGLCAVCAAVPPGIFRT